MQILDGGSLDGQAVMHREDMGTRGLEDFDVIVLVKNNIIVAAAQVVSNEDCTPGSVQVDEAIFASLVTDDGAAIEIQKITPKGGISEIQISVDSRGEVPIESAIVWVGEHASGIQQLLKRRPVFKGLELDWKDAEICPLHLKIIDTKPTIGNGDVAIIDTSGMEILFDLVPAKEMGFNTILCIDVSGSMLNADFIARDVGKTIDFLKGEYSMESHLEAFFDQFRDGEAVSRISSAAAASLLYLALKAKRGLGENVQVVAFGDDVEVLEMENAEGVMSSVIECSGKLRDLNLNTLAFYITEKTKNAVGLTAMSVALKIAAEQVDRFPKNPRTGKPDPTMIILLSDGNPNKGDEQGGIPVNPIPVAREFLAKEGVVMFTIGLGEADDLLMEKLGREVGRGDYLKATSLEQLWNFYDQLSGKFSISIKSKKDTAPAGKTPLATPRVVENSPACKPRPATKQPNPAPKAKTPAGGATAAIANKTPAPTVETITVYFTATIGPGEKQVELQVDKNARVESVKQTVGNIFGLFPPDFHLAHGGVTMDENRAVKAYKVEHGDTILIIPASNAGSTRVA